MSAHFDADALFSALDEQRRERGLSWTAVAREVWEQSSRLNEIRASDHPISPATLTNIAKRHDTTCQHALLFLRWLDRTPESFLVGGASSAPDRALPVTTTAQRPRWDLHALYDAMDARRREQQLTWAELAATIGCSPHQISNLGRVRYAIGMRLAMRITQWLGRPAADFVVAARW